MSDSLEVVLAVNGVEYPLRIDSSRSLVSVVRGEIGLTGTKEGCDDCECGACMVLLDGRPVNSCSYLAVQAEGRAITTIEGIAGIEGIEGMTGIAGSKTGDRLAPLQRNLLAAGGVQCGFCTPGMILSATALLARNPSPTDDEIGVALAGNLCRCTGYAKIIEAVRTTASDAAADNA